MLSRDNVQKKKAHSIFFQSFFLASPTNKSHETKLLTTNDTPDLEFYVNYGKQMLSESLINKPEEATPFKTLGPDSTASLLIGGNTYDGSTP